MSTIRMSRINIDVKIDTEQDNVYFEYVTDPSMSNIALAKTLMDIANQLKEKESINGED